MGENANHGVKFVAHFCLTNSRVVNAATLIDVDSSPRLFSHAGYFQVTGRCFDGYGLQSVRIQSQATDAPTDRLFFLKGEGRKERKKKEKKKKAVSVALGGMKIDAGNADCEGWREICSNLVRAIKSVRTLRVVLHIPAHYYAESV